MEELLSKLNTNIAELRNSTQESINKRRLVIKILRESGISVSQIARIFKLTNQQIYNSLKVLEKKIDKSPDLYLALKNSLNMEEIYLQTINYKENL